MFDPSKYDNDAQNNKSEKLFSDKVKDIIKYLDGVRALIIAECNSMESYIEKNPKSKAVAPFNEKLGGWAKVLIGLDILKEKYEVE